MEIEEQDRPAIARRFRGFLPVVVDVETAGFDAQRHALLEIAAIIIRMIAIQVNYLARRVVYVMISTISIIESTKIFRRLTRLRHQSNTDPKYNNQTIGFPLIILILMVKSFCLE